jgi:primosomal protein N' (replication factor Y)
MSVQLSVLVHTPAHSQLAGPLTYQSELPLAPGTLVRVPLGQRETLGVVWNTQLGADAPHPPPSNWEIKPITAVLGGLQPLSDAWKQLVGFSASYYQRSLGEVALSALPPQLKGLDATQLERRLRRKPLSAPSSEQSAATESDTWQPTTSPWAPPELTPAQAEVLQRMHCTHTQKGPFLLFGATGSGKTEVYLRAVQKVLEADPKAQALVMVPEINLTPQLEARFEQRFAQLLGADFKPDTLVSMHSGMTGPQRLKSWLAAHQGNARIVLGTRMAIFASMPHLQLIVVDEEHDPSYKQQEGARYSARDLAVFRARLENAPVILGSATPSLESWHHSRPAAEGGRYLRLEMPDRVGGQSSFPLVRRVDMNHQPKSAVFSPPLLQAIQDRVARGEQCMVLLNRRGYAPVLQCSDCDWKSACAHCSAYRVFHKIDRTLRCHHCGYTERVPRHCPACGNPDIRPLGRGTEQLEEHLSELLHAVARPDGSPVRVARIDADTTQKKGTLESQLASVHAGDVDVLVGTQMIAKGHDFRGITLVAALNPDGALFSSDFRAPERLFSLLLQAAGRAGRSPDLSAQSEMWVQTHHPQHPLYAALKAHNYPEFARQQLSEREQSTLPPFSYQALLRADARTQEVAQGFLNAARLAATQLPAAEHVSCFAAVPLTIQRVANVERAQMLLESTSRTALQHHLAQWHTLLHALKKDPAYKGVIRWAVDVDPLAI